MPKDVGSDKLFDDISDNREDISAAEDAAALHGTPFSSMQSIRVTRISIFNIEPDRLQPRRIVPSELRHNWNLSTETLQEFLLHWMDITNIDPRPYFEDGFEAPDYVDPMLISLQRIIRLAAEIRRNDLTNPITVSRITRSAFQLETGERRWLAFHILFMVYGDGYKDIPTRVMNEKSIWRQASENNQRDDLNAIGKARQYALLMMDLLTSENELIFDGRDRFADDVSFYAQVNNKRVPSGKGELIQQAMGFENRSTVSRHRDLLSLPIDIWDEADDHDAPESLLRKLLDKSYEEQRRIFNTWVSGNQIVASGNNLVKSKKQTLFEKFENKLKRFEDSQIEKVKQMNEDERLAAAEQLIDLAERIKTGKG